MTQSVSHLQGELSFWVHQEVNQVNQINQVNQVNQINQVNVSHTLISFRRRLHTTLPTLIWGSQGAGLGTPTISSDPG